MCAFTVRKERRLKRILPERAKTKAKSLAKPKLARSPARPALQRASSGKEPPASAAGGKPKNRPRRLSRELAA